MKRYLITGALAFVACATLTSCHSDDELSGSLIEQKLQTYEQVFKQEFGEVNPNQDWGFGTAKNLVRTRADGEFANIHGEYADANLWTSKGFHAPDALTPGQKLRVQFYFQTVKNPGGTHNYGTIDFFMQQVYDGATDPITDYSSLGYTSPTYSKEVYPAANGTNFIESGEHMDHLTASDDQSIEHINNFNNGNFPNPNPHVANWDQTVQDDPAQEHSDQIMLMLNTPTKYFGYANSDASYVRTDRWTLVSGDVIDNYCDNVNSAGWQAFLAAHSGVVDDPCYDEWERSYIGFDFDMLPDKDLYATIAYDASGNILYNENQTPARTEYIYFGIPFDGKDQSKIWNGNGLVDLTDVGEIGYVNNQAYFYPFKKGTRKKINVLTEKTNMYCGTPETWEDSQGKYVYSDNGTSYLRVDYVYQALDDMKMPVKDNHRKWVTIGNCADGYYSDWIVSFLPANPNNTITPQTDEIPIEHGSESSYVKRTYKQLRFITKFNQCGRIMCEDLGTSSISDIDFNDIVFDAWMYDMKPQIRTKIVKVENGSVTETLKDWSNDWEDAPSEYDNLSYTITDVYLLAGGGTIPATVAGISLKNAFGTDNGYLVNTVDEHDPQNIKRYGNPYDNTTGWKQPKELRGIENLESFNDIDVVVLYNNSPVPLTSEIGEVPHKICVPIETKWPYERIVINEAYDFNDYVKNGSSVQYVGENDEPIYNSNREIIGYYLDEMNRGDENNEDENNNIWKKTPTKSQEDNRYTDINTETTGIDITGIPYRDSARVIGSATDPVDLDGYEEETISGGSSSGYHNGDPVLIRRRH